MILADPVHPARTASALTTPRAARLRSSDMAFSLETHVLPLLQEMATDPLGDFPLRQRIEQLGLAESPQRVTRLLDYLRDSGYVAFAGQRNPAARTSR